MNDLLKGSSEFSRDRSNRSDTESGHGPGNSGDLGLAGFFNKVQEIEKQYEKLDKHLKKLQGAHEETKAVTKAPAMKSIKQRMERDVDEVGKISRFIKGKIEELDREMVDRLIETGYSEQIFQKAIMEQGRGQVGNMTYVCNKATIMDTLAEIQERHDAVRGLEKKLLDLQQVFLDMAVLVDAQGEMLDNIENMVSSAVDHVQSGNNQLTKALKKQKSSRKWMCISILILLIIVIITVVSVLKPWTQKHGA
ncbi:hypothetical protein Bca101_074415 [Brassica carinata]